MEHCHRYTPSSHLRAPCRVLGPCSVDRQGDSLGSSIMMTAPLLRRMSSEREEPFVKRVVHKTMAGPSPSEIAAIKASRVHVNLNEVS